MKKILVVDDDRYVYRLISMVLEKDTFTVIHASDGFEGLEKAKKEKPDLILLDLMLPGMEGHNVLSTLKAIKSTRDIPVVMLTPSEDEKTVRHIKEGDTAGYIVKPLKTDALLEKIGNILKVPVLSSVTSKEAPPLKKILSVDDDPLILEMISAVLEGNMFTVIHASDGWDGFEKAKKEKPDLILLDLMLPEMDGTDVLMALKSMQSTRDIPVVLLTSLTDEKTVHHARNAGIKGYIMKPFNPETLFAKVCDIFDISTASSVDESSVQVDTARGGTKQSISDRRTKDSDSAPSEISLDDLTSYGMIFLLLLDDFFLKVLDSLKDKQPQTVQNVAKMLEITDTRRLNVLLRFLSGTGILKSSDGEKYELSSENEESVQGAAAFLSGIPTFFDTIFRKGVMRQKELLSTGSPAFATEEERKKFVFEYFEKLPLCYRDAIDFLSLHLAGKLKNFVLVAPYPEGYIFDLSRHYPSCEGLLIVANEKSSDAKDFLDTYEMTEQIRLQVADPNKTVFPQKRDLVILSMQGAIHGRGDMLDLTRKAATSVADGGTLLIHDYLLENDKNAPVHAVAVEWMFSLMRGAVPFLTSTEIKEHALSLKLQLRSETVLTDSTQCLIFQKGGGR